MRNDNDGTAIVAKGAFEPMNRFRVEVVRRFVEEKEVGLFEERLAKGDAAAFPSGELADDRVVRREDERVGGDVDMAVEFPTVDGVDFFLERSHFLHQLVEVVRLVGIAHQDRNFVETVDFRLNRRDGFRDVLADGRVEVELRLLSDVFAGHPLDELDFAVDILVDLRHNLQEGRLPGAVFADDADFRAVIEGQADVLEDRFVSESLRNAIHFKDKMRRHRRVPFVVLRGERSKMSKARRRFERKRSERELKRAEPRRDSSPLLL